MADPYDVNAISALLAEFSTRLNDMEERQRLIKERVLMISRTLLKQGEKLNREMSILKDDMKLIIDNIDKMRDAIQHIIHESSEFARKEELHVLEKYMKMWEPLNYARMEDVKDMINKALKRKR
jgi:methionine synthase II (cobalamin-independent)